MSQLPVVMSNKTTALRRPTLHWDFSFFIRLALVRENVEQKEKKKEKVEDFLSESLLFGFQDEIITSQFMIDGSVFLSFRISFSFLCCGRARMYVDNH